MSDLAIFPRWKTVALWVGAITIMISAIIYQRSTGPTYPRKGTFEAGGKAYKYKLIRSEWTKDDARAILPSPGEGYSAKLHFKRFKTKDAFTEVQMEADKDEDGQPILVGLLPKQPAAGKLEYFVTLHGAGIQGAQNDTLRIPSEGEALVIRFKDWVPEFVLFPHIFMMFFSVLFGMRAGLSALAGDPKMRRHVWVALVGMTIGGMTLGPFVQKYAFGEYWTGFPWGGDWTDNKMLIMWLAWLFAAAIIGFKVKPKEGLSRAAVLVASVVMTGAYLVPHSMGGSELNYEAVDKGIDPKEAIKTGMD